MSENPSWDDYIPEAKCSDCGRETIIPFLKKPDYPENCDGFCWSCGCVWRKTVVVITKPRPSFDKSYDVPYPWGPTLKVINVVQPQLQLISGIKEVPDLKQPIDSIFPSDYAECDICGYDHKYDASAAARKHKAL